MVTEVRALRVARTSFLDIIKLTKNTQNTAKNNESRYTTNITKTSGGGD